MEGLPTRQHAFCNYLAAWRDVQNGISAADFRKEQGRRFPQDRN
jgi:hypothetical protein